MKPGTHPEYKAVIFLDTSANLNSVMRPSTPVALANAAGITRAPTCTT
jgi:ribosomal protein L31